MPVCGSGGLVCSSCLLIRRAQRARYQAETPPILLSRFPEPALYGTSRCHFSSRKLLHDETILASATVTCPSAIPLLSYPQSPQRPVAALRAMSIACSRSSKRG